MTIYDKNRNIFTNGCLVEYNGKNYDLSISNSGVHLSGEYEEKHIEARDGDILEEIMIVTVADKLTGNLFEIGE
jgi:hypothetical protein